LVEEQTGIGAPPDHAASARDARAGGAAAAMR
jgi:hypothetical protein